MVRILRRWPPDALHSTAQRRVIHSTFQKEGVKPSLGSCTEKSHPKLWLTPVKFTQAATELDGLDAEERGQLRQGLDDLVIDSPNSEVAGLRFKRLMKNVRKESYDAAKTVRADHDPVLYRGRQ